MLSDYPSEAASRPPHISLHEVDHVSPLAKNPGSATEGKLMAKSLAMAPISYRVLQCSSEVLEVIVQVSKFNSVNVFPHAKDFLLGLLLS